MFWQRGNKIDFSLICNFMEEARLLSQRDGAPRGIKKPPVQWMPGGFWVLGLGA
ncbi:hypothetical protein [Allofranklinella schreckenbergeri]|uniref:hypothetical protein n=1 Tax=Allofranklinella schreckenbergeri TaxID=1076744 RepID=UPI001EEDA8BC|nr:hypothetical protein [Allofranklinella schreckenbergeri]